MNRLHVNPWVSGPALLILNWVGLLTLPNTPWKGVATFGLILACFGVRAGERDRDRSFFIAVAAAIALAVSLVVYTKTYRWFG